MEYEKEWVKYINQINIIRERRNKNINRNIATKHSMNILKKWVSENIAENLWLEDYEKFLMIQNGFEFNGLIFYGTQDNKNNLISENEAWDWKGESFGHKYLFLGDADISWYIFDIKDNFFAELDKPSGDLIQKFNDFDSMLIYALQIALKI